MAGTHFSGPVYIGRDGFMAVPGVDASAYNTVGNGVADDLAALQAAIDATSASGGGIVHVPNGNYAVSNAVQLKEKVGLVLSPGATITGTNVDANVIEWAGADCFLEGGKIKGPPSFNKACVYIQEQGNGATDNSSRQRTKNGVYSCFLQGSTPGHTGTGLKLECTSDDGQGGSAGINWMTFTDVVLDQFDTCIHLVAKENTGETRFVNANHFSNIGMDNFVKGIHLDGSQGTGQGDVGGNQFENIQMQADPDTTHFLHFEDAIGNAFAGKIWDVSAATALTGICVVDSGCLQNHFNIRTNRAWTINYSDWDDFFTDPNPFGTNIYIGPFQKYPAWVDFPENSTLPDSNQTFTLEDGGERIRYRNLDYTADRTITLPNSEGAVFYFRRANLNYEIQLALTETAAAWYNPDGTQASVGTNKLLISTNNVEVKVQCMQNGGYMVLWQKGAAVTYGT